MFGALVEEAHDLGVELVNRLAMFRNVHVTNQEFRVQGCHGKAIIFPPKKVGTFGYKWELFGTFGCGG
jgi:hypothetical protein